MDLASPLKPDVFRVVVVILLPGILATFPWLGWFFWPDLLNAEYWREAGLVASLFVLAIGLTAGMVLEDLGAHIEVNHIDKHACDDAGLQREHFDDQWMNYLMTSSADGFIAHRYLRSMVTRFKFELAMIPACLSAALAIALAWCNDLGFDAVKTLFLLGALTALGWFFYDQAKKAGRQLHALRVRICNEEAAAKGRTAS